MFDSLIIIIYISIKPLIVIKEFELLVSVVIEHYNIISNNKILLHILKDVMNIVYNNGNGLSAKIYSQRFIARDTMDKKGKNIFLKSSLWLFV